MEISKYNTRKLGNLDLYRCVFQCGLLRNTRRTDYKKILHNWLNTFHEEQVFIGLYEQIASQPKELLTKICGFLNVRDPSKCELKHLSDKVWQSPSLDMPPAVRWILKRKYAPTVRHVKSLYHDAIIWESNQHHQCDDIPWWGKCWVYFLFHIATLPYNGVYVFYDFIRGLKMRYRFREEI